MKYLIYLICILLIACSGEKGDLNQDDTGYPSELFDKIAKSGQLFVISNERDTIIKGSEGTTVLFPKDCFAYEGGDSVTEPVSIELKEFFSISDMIFNNLTTMSNGELLETGGMIYIEATSNDKQVILNQKIIIELPNHFGTNDVQLFSGNMTDNNINWVPDTNGKVTNRELIAVDSGESDTIYFYNDGSSSNRMKGSQYLIETFNLKWLNVDKFLDYPNKETCTLNNADYSIAYFLLFDEFKSITTAYSDKEQNLIFQNIPIGKKAKLIGLRYNDNKTFIGIKEIKTDKLIDAYMDYKEKTISELKSTSFI